MTGDVLLTERLRQIRLVKSLSDSLFRLFYGMRLGAYHARHLYHLMFLVAARRAAPRAVTQTLRHDDGQRLTEVLGDLIAVLAVLARVLII